jgi:predicted hotdog family 3-hydroxylacyl-ACP dehydratase
VARPEYALDQVLPHRNGMRLIDRLLSSNHREAIVEATPTKHWPLRQSNHISSLVAVELSAQTAGVLVGSQARRTKGASLHGKGWLVGIKQATFHQNRFQIGTTIRIRAHLGFSYKTFHEIETVVFVNETPAANIMLQVFWVETD